MKLTRRSALLAATGAAVATLLSLPATAAGTTINVSLWDKGGMSMETMGKMPAMGMMMGGDMAMAMMGITADQATVPAGEVTFAVTNTSKDLIHEMVVTAVADPAVPLPYVEDEQRVDEDAAGHVGEVAELDTGATGSLTVTLTPGTYVLYCNVPGHYQMGMWTVITVTG
ncbi:plastocyanin/azurin family copper-binding protein [Tabrizicola sp.]|uniref:plastocyanin/azurin family copper-binding protein n=1 Tax=Tabrizicola sp. TaxID=2005166 RepID=UPI00286B9581|nr:plastocyanin/azurin family copper-binding protein [Tabrizicola sp.]